MRMSMSLVAAAVAGVAASTAEAHIVTYLIDLSGPNEAPPNSSLGRGTGRVTVDLDLVTMRVEVEFSGLTGTVTASHIHGPTSVPLQGTAGVMTPTPTFPNFPLGVTSGAYDQTFDLTLASSYNQAFITASGGTVGQAMNRMLLAFEEGRAYLNIHTTAFPGGEIRGFLIAVPAPGCGAVLAMAGLVAGRRRR